MVLRVIELLFAFFSKMYIFFYKERGEYWRIFPVIIMSTIVMINLRLIMSFLFSPGKYFIFGLATFWLFIFHTLIKKREYNWVVLYPISRKQKIIIVSVLIIDALVVAVLSVVSRNIYIATH